VGQCLCRRVSRYGLVAYSSSLDAIGPLANSVVDAATVLQAIACPDANDATASSAPVRPPATPSFTSTTPLFRVRCSASKGVCLCRGWRASQMLQLTCSGMEIGMWGSMIDEGRDTAVWPFGSQSTAKLRSTPHPAQPRTHPRTCHRRNDP